MFENPRRGRQARNFTTNNPKILDLKSSSEQIFSRKLPLGAPVIWDVKVRDATFFGGHNHETVNFCFSVIQNSIPGKFNCI